MKKLEIACFNEASALIADKAKVDRIELCENKSEGGITPAIDLVKKVKKQISTDLFVMIRPRGGDFIYSDEEFEQMKQSIIEFKKIGVNGFVFGILQLKDGINRVNKKQNTELIELAKPLPCTFHRAFDNMINYKHSLNDAIDCGFSTVLTSGCKPSIATGKSYIKDIMVLNQNRITIMPGGGVRAANIKELDQKVEASFYHSSAIIDDSEIANYDEIIALKLMLISAR